MHYEINVAWLSQRHGGTMQHFFATHERSITSERAAIEALEVFDRKFPAGEGFTVTCSLVNTTGREVGPDLRRKIRQRQKP